MGLVRIVVQKPDGESFDGLGVGLYEMEPTQPDRGPVDSGVTDKEGVVRFWVEPAIYVVRFEKLPEDVQPPKYGTMVKLEDIAEGIEQIIRLDKAGQTA
ncbi:hypothetical protein ACFLVJ_02705 [Chloroflexota bacterium]